MPDRRTSRRVAAAAGAVLAALLVLFGLVAPGDAGQLTPAAFVRIPLEGLLGAALVLALPTRVLRPGALVVGVLLGLLTLLRGLDVGFSAVLARPFDPVHDWAFAGSTMDALRGSVGRGGAVGAVVAAGLLVVAVPVLMALSVRRLALVGARVGARHRVAATRVVAVLTVGWVVCAGLGVRLVTGVPVAADSVATRAYAGAFQVRDGLLDQRAFAAAAADDAFGATPGDQLLTGLRGKDVVVAFVESYGRSALEDPRYAPQVGAVLDAGGRRLAAAGFTARSAFLTSPTAGGGSWLAHATLLSGLWIDNQRRHRALTGSDRLTLTRAFHRAGHRTVAVLPGTDGQWPESRFFGFDEVYNVANLGYRGRPFSWISGMPDQYALTAFERQERGIAGHTPIMAEIDLTSSHEPWAPIPRLVGWNDVGDGTVFTPMTTEGDPPDVVWRDQNRIRTEYRRSVEYSLNTLISYLETYGDDNLVLVFLGDHQPAPLITGSGASRDVPVTIVAKDRHVTDQIAGWGWQDGLRPGPKAPVWPMDDFRDRFLTAYGSTPH